MAMPQSQTTPLFVFEPDRNSPERKRRMALLLLGVLSVLGIFGMLLFFHMPRTESRLAEVLALVCAMLFSLLLYLHLGRRGGYHLAYEFYPDHMKLKHIHLGGGGRADGQGLVGYDTLLYSEIGGLETVPNPFCTDGGLVDVHVRVIPRAKRRAMCGLLNFFDTEFYLYCLPAGQNPQARIDEAMRRFFQAYPAEEISRQQLIEEEKLLASKDAAQALKRQP